MVCLRWMVLVLSCLITQALYAGPLDEARARAHLNAIAAGDLEGVMQDYADDADMDWVGGPLDGRYHGKAAIRVVWQKFFAANGGKSRPIKLSTLNAYSNAKGSSLETEVAYGGVTPVKVWQAFTYRDDVLTTEIWQVAPAITLAP